ncbi:MAG: ABC transporter permease subunit [Clostridia bacterium]
MNIFMREMRTNLKSLLIWSVSMWLLILVGMVKYSGIAAAGNASIDLFNAMPEALKSIFGLSGVDITTVAGFYGMFFLYFMLLAGIHSGMLGATIISKEERDKTADYIFAKPRTRAKIISGKLLALFANIIVLNIVTCVASISSVAMYNQGKSLSAEITMMMIALFAFQLIFAAIGLLASALVGTSKKATSLTTLVLLSTYALSVAINIQSNLKSLRFLTPFRYFEGVDLMKGKALELNYLLLSGIIIVIMVLASYYLYEKRDLKV